MYSIDFMKIETHAKLSFHCSDFWLPILPPSRLIQKTERSDTIILGILGTLVHFRHSGFRHSLDNLIFTLKDLDTKCTKIILKIIRGIDHVETIMGTFRRTN